MANNLNNLNLNVDQKCQYSKNRAMLRWCVDLGPLTKNSELRAIQ